MGRDPSIHVDDLPASASLVFGVHVAWALDKLAAQGVATDVTNLHLDAEF